MPISTFPELKRYLLCFSRPGLTKDDSVDVWAGEIFRAARLVVDLNGTMSHNGTVLLDGVKLLRFVPDPSQALPNPAYYQTIHGLMNVTSPTAGGV